MSICGLEQQQSKGLDTSWRVRLAGNKARGYTKLGQPNQLDDLIK